MARRGSVEGLANQMGAKEPVLTYLIKQFDQTGPMRAPYQICRAFLADGWRVEIVAPAVPEDKPPDNLWGGATLSRLAAANRKIAQVKLALTPLRRPEKQLYLSEIWGWYVYALPLAKWLFGRPYALALDSYIHRSGAGWTTRLRERLRYELPLRCANLILAESPEAYAAARRYIRRPVVIHVPVCLWQVDLTAVEATWTAANFNPQREKTILFTGRLVERKRAHDLIAAFARLTAAFPEWRLEIRGLPASAAYEARLNQLINQYQLAEKAAIRPPLSGAALYQRYRETAVYALPSEGEGMPTTILEAMYFGGAIVAGISGAVGYQLEEGRCGLLHHPGDLDSLTSHLQTLMTSEAERDGYRERARARLLALFVWERYLPELTQAFRQAWGTAV